MLPLVVNKLKLSHYLIQYLLIYLLHASKKFKSIQHITLVCKIIAIAHEEYKQRHDNVAKIVNLNLALKYTLIAENVLCYKDNRSKVLKTKIQKAHL